MAGDLQLTWEIEGERQLSRRLRGISADLRDWTPALKKSVQTLKKIFETDVFGTEGRAIGETWSPLSRAYAAKKRERYGNKGILEASGRMRDSFETMTTSDLGRIHNTSRYFKYHQSNRPRKKIPRRIMMKLGKSQKEIVVKIFQASALEKLNR